MTAPQTDAPTLQERLRGIPRGWIDTALGSKAADALDARDATIAALVGALEGIQREYDPSEDGQNALTMHKLARAALAQTQKAAPQSRDAG